MNPSTQQNQNQQKTSSPNQNQKYQPDVRAGGDNEKAPNDKPHDQQAAKENSGQSPDSAENPKPSDY